VTPIGKFYVRREPQGDAGDVVVLKGTTVEEPLGGGTIDLLIVSSSTFGATVDGWEDLDALFTSAEFITEYRPQTEVERSVLALEQAANAEAAAKANEDRISPWAYFHVPPPKRARS